MKSLLQDYAIKVDDATFASQIQNTLEVLTKERSNGNIAGGKVTEGLVEICNLNNLAVISDLHADSKTFFKILCELDYEQFLSDPFNKIIFLGDYVDRGSDSISILYSICYLKSVYPNSIILMRGNHESPADFPFASHNLPYEIQGRFGDIKGRSIYNQLLSMFKLLTLITIVKEKLLLVHGGLPTEESVIKNYRQTILTSQQNHIANRVVEELLWNDPRNINESCGWEPSRRGFGRHFGISISNKWLEATRTKVIVRGHEPCHGFRLDHDDKILTLFSCKEAYPAFNAAYIKITCDQLCSVNSGKDLSSYVRLLKFP